MNHTLDLQNQFSLRADVFEKSARWITDQTLLQSHVQALGLPDHIRATSPGQGYASGSPKLLELCCGTGVVGRALKKAGWDVRGVDVTKAMVEIANKNFPAVVGSVEELPFANCEFDAAVMRQAYFLLDQGPRALAEIRRVLKPDGIFVLSQLVPFGSKDAPYLKQIHENKQKQMKRFFTSEDLVTDLQAAQFKIIRKNFVVVRESVTQWMAHAPEMDQARRDKVCEMILNAPNPYREIHQVDKENGEITENWNWTIITSQKVEV